MKLSLLLASLYAGVALAIFFDPQNITNFKEVTSLLSTGLLDYYTGDKYGGTIGMFSWPYYWWEAGGAWGSLIDYTYLMENDSLVPTIKAALEFQTGNDNNYIPLNQSTTEGNDDQGFWGLAVMAAAERNFSNPTDPDKAWLSLAQAVYNTMTARWDENECNGGLRWQIFQWNSGYDYKNSVSNGCLFNIAARLARYTGNDSYVEWAEKVWEWMEGVGLMSDDDWWFIYDGATVGDNCTNITHLQWSYNQGLFLSGSAVLANYTNDPIWYNRTMNLLKGTGVFFKNNTIMYEAACQGETVVTCNQDQRSFKAYLSRFLGLTSVMVADTRSTITDWLTTSAQGAALACSGGTDGHTCGLDWLKGSWDGYYGLGEQMAALEVMQNLRVHDLPPPYTANTGGSSISNPSGGYGVSNTGASPLKLDTGDTAGAGVLTAIIGVSLVASGIWLVI